MLLFSLGTSITSRMILMHQTPGRSSLKASEAVTDIPKLLLGWEKNTEKRKKKQISKQT